MHVRVSNLAGGQTGHTVDTDWRETYIAWTRVAYLDPFTRHENACMRAATHDPAHFLLLDITLENIQSHYNHVIASRVWASQVRASHGCVT